MTADKDGVDLLPCPFCGGEASDAGHIAYNRALDDTTWADGSPVTEAFYVNCIACGAVARSGFVGGFQTKVEAIERWNHRARPTPAHEQGLLEEAEAVLERALIGSQKYLRARVRTAISLIEKARHSSTPTEGAQ